MSDLDEASDWDEPDDRRSRKRDRLARLLSVASILYSKGSTEAGVPVTEIARLTDMTTRTVYRDIRALDEELGVPSSRRDAVATASIASTSCRRCAFPCRRRSSSSWPPASSPAGRTSTTPPS